MPDRKNHSAAETRPVPSQAEGDEETVDKALENSENDESDSDGQDDD